MTAVERPAVPAAADVRCRVSTDLPELLCPGCSNIKCISSHGKCRANNVCVEARLPVGPADSMPWRYHNCRSLPSPCPPQDAATCLHRPPRDPRHGYCTQDTAFRRYYYHPGLGVCMCSDPTSRLNAVASDMTQHHYTRGLQSLPGRPWPQWAAWITPYRRGRGKQYGWYYQGSVVKERHGQHRELPWVERVDPASKASQDGASRWSFHLP